MADEAMVQTSLAIRKTSGSISLIDYAGRPTSFKADVDGTKGPAPGAVSVSINGTDIDLSQFDQPGFCRVHNQDASNRIDIGVYEPASGTFYPMIEVGPGQSYVFKLSRNLREEFSGTVTGTGTIAENNTLRAKAYVAAVNALFEIFEA